MVRKHKELKITDVRFVIHLRLIRWGLRLFLKVYEPSEIAERMMTEEDERIRVTDLPERFQVGERFKHTHDVCGNVNVANIDPCKLCSTGQRQSETGGRSRAGSRSPLHHPTNPEGQATGDSTAPHARQQTRRHRPQDALLHPRRISRSPFPPPPSERLL